MSFKDLIKLGSSSKYLYLVTGSKHVLQFFTNRKTEEEPREEKATTQQVIVDDSYYVYVLHRR